MVTVTDNMGLTLPEVSTTRSYGTFAISWAAYLSQNLFKIDNHNHTNGKGSKIAWGSLIQEGLYMNQFGMSGISSIQLSEEDDSENIPLTSLFSDGENLFWKPLTGDNVQITESGAVPVNTTGGFTGDYGVDGSSASFDGVYSSFIFFGTNSSSHADIGAESIAGRNLTVSELVSTVTLTGSSNLTNIANYAPDIQTNGWKLWNGANYRFLTTSLSYPFDVKRDEYGGVTVSGQTNAQYFSGQQSVGYKSYFNTGNKGSFYLTLVNHAYELPTTDNGWVLSGSGSIAAAEKTFEIVEDINETYVGGKSTYGSTNVLSRRLMFFYPFTVDIQSATTYSFPTYSLAEWRADGTTYIKVRLYGNKLYDPTTIQLWYSATGTRTSIQPFLSLNSLMRVSL